MTEHVKKQTGKASPSGAERQQKFREKMQSHGYKRFEIWMPPESSGILQEINKIGGIGSGMFYTFLPLALIGSHKFLVETASLANAGYDQDVCHEYCEYVNRVMALEGKRLEKLLSMQSFLKNREAVN